MRKLMRSIVCEKFLKINKVNCCTIISENDEGSFSHNGCECCRSGLGTTVYECNGYSPKQKTIVVLGDVCSECICYFYNGEDSQIEVSNG